MSAPDTPDTPQAPSAPDTPATPDTSRPAGPRFGPTVLVGTLSAALVAFAGSRSWVEIPEAAQRLSQVTGQATIGEVPLVGALGLVLLACWGVLLVTRGKVRRAVALLGVVTAVGALVASVVGLGDVGDSAVRELAKAGYADAEVPLNLWGWISPVFAVISAGLCWLAFTAAPRWPEMGRKYDAPRTRSSHDDTAAGSSVVADTANLDLWKSLDEGHDPTDVDTDPR